MFPTPRTIREIAEWIGASVQGDDSVEVISLASLTEAQAGELTFAVGEKHTAKLAQSLAAAAIVARDASVGEDCKIPLLRVENVQEAMGRLLGALAPPEDLPGAGISPSATIDKSATLAPDAAIGPNVVIGPRAAIGAGTALCAGVQIGTEASIGEKCVLCEGVVVRRGCCIGDRVRIGSNSVVGYDGFGYYFDGKEHRKIPHAGNVVIEDDVELGACVCVDRAKWGSTRIGAGSKIDNLVQIAHSVQVGPGCIIVAQVGIAGSAKLGRGVVLGGHVGIRDNIEIGDGTEIGACSCLAQSAGPGEKLFGIPAKNARTRLREIQALSKLPELLKRVKSLEATIGERKKPDKS